MSMLAVGLVAMVTISAVTAGTQHTGDSRTATKADMERWEGEATCAISRR